MSNGPNSSPPASLNSWKEIARFFERDVRTVQRWEKEEGMPVHRHLHQQHSTVYAHPEELAEWWKQRAARLAQESPARSKPRKTYWHAIGIVLGTAFLITAVYFWRAHHEKVDETAQSVPQHLVLEGAPSDGELGAGLWGDLNGDGRDDLVISASGAGKVYLLFGGKVISAQAPLPSVLEVTIRGSQNRSLDAGQVGDFNGDGIDDLVLNQMLREPETFHATGPSYVLWGRRQWPAQLDLPAAADVTLRVGLDYDIRMGGCLFSAAGDDLNGDGLADIFLGAADFGVSEDRRGAGAVFVVYGRKTWTRELDVRVSADLTIHGARTGESLGPACALGDFDGDARADLAVSAGESSLWNLLGGRGRAYLFAGHKRWPRQLDARSDFAVRVDGAKSGTLGTYVLLADLNGDTRQDFVVYRAGSREAPEAPGEILAWFGGRAIRGVVAQESADLRIHGDTPSSLREGAASPTDLDRDGLSDLVLADPASGSVYLLPGRPNWPGSGRLRDYSLVTLFQGTVGVSLPRLGFPDFDGDGLPELVFTSTEARPQQQGAASSVQIVRSYQPIRVDVRPEAEQNVVLWPAGTCSARVYGFSREAQDQVVPSSVRMAGVPAMEHRVEDFDRDGILDVQGLFDSQNMNLKPETRRITLTARTRGGKLLGGSDSIQVVLRENHKKAASSSP